MQALPPPIDVAYDTEIFPNFFSCVVSPLDLNDPTQWRYEISERRNDGPVFVHALRSGYWKRMFGFFSLNFDSPLIHHLVKLIEKGETNAAVLTHALKMLANEIIAAGSRWSHRVHWRDEIVKQGDLYLIHHFDNPSRSTSLKTLEFNLRARHVQDLPFPHDEPLLPWQMNVVLDYNANDTAETKRFAHESREMIAFRDSLGPKFLNYNDPKIGTSFFVDRLEARAPGSCYDENRKPRQTWRTSVDLSHVILPWITFERPENQAVLDRLKSTVLSADEIKVSEGAPAKVATKGVFKNLTSTVDGFTFVFGTGGLHGSVSRRIAKADATHEIADIDVTGYYPRIAIVNGFYPEHLGPIFVEIYKELMEERVTAKDAGEFVKADALKLANNGVYGNSNNYFGPFLDPQYTMKITINGQLMLVVAAEQFLKIPGLEILQANTDGLTMRFPRNQRARFDAVCEWWQRGTGMRLEEKQYDTMWIRDVNAYLARYSQDEINKGDKGKYKSKNAYDFELKVGNQKAWHKDHSGLIIPKAARAVMAEGKDLVTFISNHPDPYDFMIREKVTGQSRLTLADGTPCQQTTRYYIAHDGQAMFKHMPPLAKAPGVWRKSAVHAEGQATAYGTKGALKCSICGDHGPTFKFKYEFDAHNSDAHTFKVKVCNIFDGGSLPGLDLNYYLQETRKLLLQ